MIVYRYSSPTELNNIINCKLDCVGSCFERSDVNTHRYKKNIKYLHFFKDLKAISEIKKVRQDNVYYICKYDIPIITLMLGRGYGYYEGRGYKYDNSTIKEYIVPVDKFSPKWLVDYERYERDIDFKKD